MAAAIHLNTLDVTSVSDFEAVKSASHDALQVVELYQQWCGRTSSVASSWRRWLLEHPDVTPPRFVFAPADLGGLPEIEKYSSTCRPTFLFLRGGQVADIVEGVHPPKLLRCLSALVGGGAGGAATPDADSAEPAIEPAAVDTVREAASTEIPATASDDYAPLTASEVAGEEAGSAAEGEPAVVHASTATMGAGNAAEELEADLGVFAATSKSEGRRAAADGSAGEEWESSSNRRAAVAGEASEGEAGAGAGADAGTAPEPAAESEGEPATGEEQGAGEEEQQA